MSTSGTLKTNDIWSKAIGHDPYAESGQETAEGHAQARLDEEKTKTLLEIARSQNTQERTSNDFVAKMYLGLKAGKKHRADALKINGSGLSQDIRKRLAEDDSSSEDEFVEKEIEIDPLPSSKEKKVKESSDKKRRKKRSRHKRRDDSSDDSDDSDDSDSSSERHRRRRKKRSKSKRRSKRKDKRRRKRDYRSDSESDSDDSDSSRESRHNRKRRHRHDRDKKGENNHKDRSSKGGGKDDK